MTGDWDLAEDCVQDGVERALARWPVDGVPENPAAWLTTTAYRRAVDVLRRRRAEADKLRELNAMASSRERLAEADPDHDPGGGIYRDDRLRLLFSCCHPALPLTGRVALTLKTVAGLSTREIARAFLVSEATMGQRLLRTRAKIAHAGITFRVPQSHRLAERVAGVLAVIYLIYNEGYAHRAGGQRGGSRGGSRSAGRAAGPVAARRRRGARVARAAAAAALPPVLKDHPDGELVPLPEQDRSRWDRSMVAAGLAALSVARATGRPAGHYRLQAEIAAEHAVAADAASTNWARVVRGYDALLKVQPSPVAELNRAAAIGFRDGPVAGLQALAGVEHAGRLAGYYLLPAVRADLLRRAGRHQEATVAYRAALELVPSVAERRLLERRAGDVVTGS